MPILSLFCRRQTKKKNVIPDHAEVRCQVMDAEDYAGTLLANCSGDAEDFICEETGKVLVVQFYVPQE